MSFTTQVHTLETLMYLGGAAATSYLPQAAERFHRPFLDAAMKTLTGLVITGGATTQEELTQTRAQVTLYSADPRVVSCIMQIKERPGSVAAAFREFASTARSQQEQHRLLCRLDRNIAEYNKLSFPQRAARLIYLSATSTDYILNNRGDFIGKFQAINLDLDLISDSIVRLSSLLKEVEIKQSGYFGIEDEAQQGDFVYFAPTPLLKLGNKCPLYSEGSYSPYRMNLFDYKQLAEVCARLDAKGVLFTVNASVSEEVLSLFKPMCLKGTGLVSNIVVSSSNGDGALLTEQSGD